MRRSPATRAAIPTVNAIVIVSLDEQVRVLGGEIADGSRRERRGRRHRPNSEVARLPKAA